MAQSTLSGSSSRPIERRGSTLSTTVIKPSRSKTSVETSLSVGDRIEEGDRKSTSRLATIRRGEPRPIARTPDQIGDLLSGKPLHDESHLIRAAQTALAKLGYAVKIDGVEDGDTRRALRDFERAHGLATTPEIGSALVSQLTGAARMGRQRKGL